MPKIYDLLIKGGLVISGSGINRADVGVKREKIASIQADLIVDEASRVIDAAGKYVMPGVIDVHVHPFSAEGLGDSSLTAAFGGTTSLIHFVYPERETKLIDAIRKYQEEGVRDSLLDFGIHGTLFDPASQIEEIPKAVDLGVTTFKMFMGYAKLKRITDDYHLTAAMDCIAGCGGLAMVHAENGSAIDYFEDRLLKRGEDPIKVFVTASPDHVEAEAIFRAVSIAAMTHCPLYVVHVTTARGLDVLKQPRSEGQVVYSETCPQYLTLTETAIGQLGALAKFGPRLRTERDRLALWDAIPMGLIDVIASDHSPKKKERNTPFSEALHGAPGAETLLTVTYDEGVNRGRIGLPKLVELLSENPAKIFGLYPKKGILQEGADADIVIFDPSQSYKIECQNQHSKATYTLYEGRKCLGKPVVSIQRGKILMEDGLMKAKPGDGKFLPTKISKENKGLRS